MKFGDYLRQRREERGWTQPEAAARAEIEQSYLSKLETGRSYPSEEVFTRLAQAYSLDLAKMAQEIDAAELERLRDVSQLRVALLSEHLSSNRRSRNWMLAGVVALALGGASMGFASLASDREGWQYTYRSMGVLQEGESVYAMEHALGGYGADTDAEFAVLQAQHLALQARIDEAYRVTERNRGRGFVENLPEGRRYYALQSEDRVVIRSPLRWFRVPGLMLLFGGIGCLVAGFRRR